MEQHGTNSPQQEKVRLHKSCVKTMLIFFFNADRIMHSKFVYEGTTVNNHCYLGVMEHMYACMYNVRNEQFQSNSWLLLHDNVPIHCILNVRQFLSSKSICVIQHPPSCQIWHQNLFLFPKMKLALNGQCCSNIRDIQCGVSELPKWVLLQDFQCNFKNLYKQSQHCVVLGGGGNDIESL